MRAPKHAELLSQLKKAKEQAEQFQSCRKLLMKCLTAEKASTFWEHFEALRNWALHTVVVDSPFVTGKGWQHARTVELSSTKDWPKINPEAPAKSYMTPRVKAEQLSNIWGEEGWEEL